MDIIVSISLKSTHQMAQDIAKRAVASDASLKLIEEALDKIIL